MASLSAPLTRSYSITTRPLGSPATSTFLAAVRNFVTLPGLTYEQLRRHQDSMISTATDKGHLDQQRQGIRSTKSGAKKKRRPRKNPGEPALDNDLLHTAASASDADAVLRIPTDDERVAMDLTGKLHKTYL